MANERVYNFSAGPSMLPLEALERAGAEITNYQGSGMSVMEMSHRSKVFDKIFQDTQAKLRKLMNVPEGYKILFLQGGAQRSSPVCGFPAARSGSWQAPTTAPRDK